jgi:hypothetical protein
MKVIWYLSLYLLQEDLRKAILASIEDFDPDNPWIVDASGRHTNVAALLDWPSSEDSDDSDDGKQKTSNQGKYRYCNWSKISSLNINLCYLNKQVYLTYSYCCIFAYKEGLPLLTRRVYPCLQGGFILACKEGLS